MLIEGARRLISRMDQQRPQSSCLADLYGATHSVREERRPEALPSPLSVHGETCEQQARNL